MSVAFVQTVTGWGGAASPQTSGAFTPAATNFLAGVASDDASGSTLTLNGSVNNLTLQASQNDAINATTLAIFGKNAIAGGSQTLTAASSAAVNIMGAAWEYSGVNTATYAASNPTATTTPAGSAVVVPVGAILLAFVRYDDQVGSALTASVNGGVTPTARGSGTLGSVYAAAEWAGNGGSITPTFSTSTSGTFMFAQVLLVQASSGGSRPPPAQITLNPGGILIGPSSFAPGKAANYGAVRWQEWEKYPWGPTSSAVITQIFAADVVGAIEAALLAGDGTLTAAEFVASIESANLRADGKLSAADFVSAIEGANLTATGALTAGDLVSAIEAGALGGLGSLSAQDVVAAIEAANVGGTGALSAGDVVGAVEVAFLDIFVVLSQITAVDVVGAVEGANLQGLGALTGADVVGAVETAALIASGTLSAADVVGAIERANLQALASGTRKLRVIGSVIVRRLH